MIFKYCLDILPSEIIVVFQRKLSLFGKNDLLSPVQCTYNFKTDYLHVDPRKKRSSFQMIFMGLSNVSLFPLRHSSRVRGGGGGC